MPSKKLAAIDQTRCVACGVCENTCPLGAVKVRCGCYAAVEAERCVGCGKCAKLCPVVKVVSTQFPPCVPAEIALISTLTRQVCTYQRLTYLLTLSTYRCADLTFRLRQSDTSHLYRVHFQMRGKTEYHIPFLPDRL